MRVSTAPEYREKWITARNWASIICLEYNIPQEVAGETIYQFLVTNDGYKRQGNGIHSKDMSASSLIKTRHLYVGTDPPNDKTPYYLPEKEKRSCSITPETRNRLLSVLLTFLEKGSKRMAPETNITAPAFPASNNNNGAASAAATNNIENNNHVAAAGLPGAIGANPSPNGMLPHAPVLHPGIAAGMVPLANPAMAIPGTSFHLPQNNVLPQPLYPGLLFQGLPPAAAAAAAAAPPAKKPTPFPVVRGPYKGKSAPCDGTVRRRAEKMESLLEDCDQATKTRVMKMLLKRKGMRGVAEDLKLEQTPKAEDSICNGIKDFLAIHNAQGSRPKHEQDAVDAVMTAVCFNKSAPLSQIGDRLDVPASKLRAICRGQVQEMKSTGEKFKPKERKRRSDCYREEAFECVSDYIHSDEVSHIDTNGKKRMYKIKHPFTKVVDTHPGRVWNISGSIASRYQTFLQSQAYADFQKHNGGNTISQEVFRLGRCGCIRDPRPEEEEATPYFGQSNLSA